MLPPTAGAGLRPLVDPSRCADWCAPPVGTTFPHSTFCPHDGNRLVPAPFAPMEPGTQRRRGLPHLWPRVQSGGQERARSTATTWFRRRSTNSAPSSPWPRNAGKICPSCGGRYGGEATFCGKDGSALVLVN